MEAYRFNDKVGNRNYLGRLIIKYKDLTILLATPTLGQQFLDYYTLLKNKEVGYLDRINLLDEKWVHPHLYKPLKDEVKSHLTQIIL